MNYDSMPSSPDDRITSTRLAALIVDALIDAAIIQRDRLDDAISITAEEIDARKAAGDY